MDMDEIVEIVAGAMCLGKECRRNCPDVEHAPCPDSLCSWREDAERILSALSARGLAVVKGWQPIETAPKGNTRILVCEEDGGTYEVWWQRSWYGDETNPGWMISNCDEEYGHYVEATHWMPLPARPSLKEGT